MQLLVVESTAPKHLLVIFCWFLHLLNLGQAVGTDHILNHDFIHAFNAAAHSLSPFYNFNLGMTFKKLLCFLSNKNITQKSH